MIEVFAGSPGSGKTYRAIKVIGDHLAAGGTVFTNIEVNREAYKSYLEKRHGVRLELDEQLKVLEDSQIPDFWQHISYGSMDCKTLVVIDEAHLYFNARAWAQTTKEHPKTMAFLSQIRHYHVHLIAICQHPSNLDSQFVRLATYIQLHRDMSTMSLGWFKFPKKFIVNQWDAQLKTRYKQTFEKPDPARFAAYNSYQDLQGVGGNAKRATVSKVRRSPFFHVRRWALPLLIVSVLVLYWSTRPPSQAAVPDVPELVQVDREPYHFRQVAEGLRAYPVTLYRGLWVGTVGTGEETMIIFRLPGYPNAFRGRVGMLTQWGRVCSVQRAGDVVRLVAEAATETNIIEAKKNE